MKTAVGVIAALLLVSTLAFGQSYQPLPFPQEANTALQGGPGDEMAPSVNVPSSMAANQSDEEIAPAYSSGDDKIQVTGSAFPGAANPALGRSTADQMTPSWHEQRELGSPFPSAANPAGE